MLNTDLLNGFSDEEIQYGEGEEEEASGLDLLTAMLDSQAGKIEEAKKSSSRKRSSSGHERRGSHEEGDRGLGVKRRKVANKENIDHTEKAAESAVSDEMSQMRGMHICLASRSLTRIFFLSPTAQMAEMQKEMLRLREEVKKAKQNEQPQCGPGGSLQLHTQRPSPLLPPTLRTEATRLPTAGQKRRVARQPNAGQKGGGRSAKANGGGGSEGAVEGQRVIDRGVADDIIRQRQEDEQGNIITEKYSRLRIK